MPTRTTALCMHTISRKKCQIKLCDGLTMEDKY